MTGSLSVRLRGRRGDAPLVGAAIGIGMMAEAAERGGVDFLLVLNAGRYRVMGAASVASLLPLQDSNALTDAVGRSEILPRASVPVFFGACTFHPALDLDRLVETIARAGYHGIANFPTCIHYDGRFRTALEEAGLGFSREAALLAIAKRAGLATFGYAKTSAETRLLCEAGIDIVCVNFGWNAGGSRGLDQHASLDEVAERAKARVQDVRALGPSVICLVEGGPIVSPDHMYHVVRHARADGYVGGSTLDRLPLELSVAQVTSAFKTVAMLRETLSEQARETTRIARLVNLAGDSTPMRELLDQVARLSATTLPILILGEPGTGKTALASALHAIGRRGGAVMRLDAEALGGSLDEHLFGVESGAGRARRAGALEAPDATVIVDRFEAVAPAVQIKLIDFLDRNVFERVGGARAVAARARLVGIVRDAERLESLRPELTMRLQAGLLRLPALRDRPEDLPAQARVFLEAAGAGRGRRLEIDAEGYRMLLAHAWPGNLGELKSVVERAALAADDGQIGAAELAAFLPGDAPQPESSARPLDEREWLLDALRRNGFRRGRTAAFLGISRKTLYNKMQRWQILR